MDDVEAKLDGWEETRETATHGVGMEHDWGREGHRPADERKHVSALFV
jgi:hypothetical protein